MGVEIHKCSYRWKDIENDQTNNLCAHCQVCVPDISDQPLEEVEEQFYEETCTRIHDRHLTENGEQYFFINKVESRFRDFGWLRLASVTVFVYLLVTGCYHRKTAGVPAYSEKNYYENHYNGKGDHNSKMSIQVGRDQE